MGMGEAHDQRERRSPRGTGADSFFAREVAFGASRGARNCSRRQRPVRIPVKLLVPDLELPRYATAGDAGLDLLAAEDVFLEPGARAAVPTGIAVAIPTGYAGFVQARSGRALKEGLALANAPGLIDSGYRGEIKVIVVNLDPDEPIHIARGDKIAQLVVQPVAAVDLEVVAELPPSQRGDGGFGSTGR